MSLFLVSGARIWRVLGLGRAIIPCKQSESESEGVFVTIQDLVRLTRRRLVTILSCVAAGILVAALALYITPKVYTASATAYVSVRVVDGSSANTGTYFSASQLANQKAQAFASVLASNAVAEGVVDRLALQETPSALASRVSATAVQNASTITVSVRASSADEARRIADSVVEVASVQLKKLDGDTSPVALELLSSASLANVVVSPSASRLISFGFVGGLLLGYALALLRSLLDRRLRLSEDIERATSVPVVAVVPQTNAIGRETREDAEPDFQSEEALRKLRTNLKFASVDDELKVCVVSSPNPAEGKSSVAFKLAQVMAAAGEDVVLIDADLRRPTVDKLFGVDGTLGLSQVLAGSVTLDRALQKTDQAGLFVLPAGQIPPNPSELLGSQKMAELVGVLSKELFVILDAPPLLPVTDAAVLSRVASGVLLVVRSGKTNTDELEVALENVARAGGKTIGIVLNGVPVSKISRLKYGDKAYSSGYGYYSSNDEARNADAGSAADFDVRAALGKSAAPPQGAETVKSFEAVVAAPQELSRRRPQFRPVSSHAER